MTNQNGGAILVGGASQRMGVDKSTVHLAGMPLLEHVVARLTPQVVSVLVVGEAPPGAETAHEMRISDCMPGRLGPLVGVLTALEWYEHKSPDVKYVFVTSVDVPFLPADVVDRLAKNREEESEIVFAESRNQIQYLAGHWPVRLAPSLRTFLEAERGLSIKRFVEARPTRTIEFDATEFDPFMNVNTAQDLADAEVLAVKLEAGPEA